MKFPRRHRFRRADDFPPMKVTERDEAILKAVHRHRFLRSHQICDLISGSRQQVLRRLQTLFHHSYLERPPCQLDYYQNVGSRSMVYGLANRGSVYLRNLSDISSTRLQWPALNLSVKRLFLEHALMVSDIMVSLEMACRKRGDVRLFIEDEISLPNATLHERERFRWTVKIPGEEESGVIPDRVFSIEFALSGERILFFLEADRGTMPIVRTGFCKSSFEKKLIAYQETWSRGIHLARFRHKRVRILAVTDSNDRANHLRDVCASLKVGNGLFLFSTRDRIVKCADVFAGPWTDSHSQITALAV